MLFIRSLAIEIDFFGFILLFIRHDSFKMKPCLCYQSEYFI